MKKTYNKANMIAAGIFFGLVVVAIMMGLFVWYAHTVIPHTYPTLYTNFFWGFTHAIFIIPTFVWSLFAHSITIYQAPNAGGWYNFGFLAGMSIIFGGSHGVRTTNKTRKAKKTSKQI